MGGDNPNDFDFGGEQIGSKKESGKKDEFDFNFGGKGVEQKKEEPAAQGGDLMDLLGGIDMNAQPQKQENALDFFGGGADNGALGAAAAQNAQNPNQNDGFNFGGGAPSGGNNQNAPFDPFSNDNSNQPQQE